MVGLKGSGNTIKHQLILSDILYEFTHKTRTHSKYKNYKCLPEISISNKVPDIVIFKIVRNQWQPKIIFEISNNSSGLLKDLEKCRKLMESTSSIDEAFVFDLSGEAIKLKKIKRGKSGRPLNPVSNQKCETFNINVLNALKSL